jgi:hypothetical protein
MTFFKAAGNSNGNSGFSSRFLARKICPIFPGKGSIPLNSSKRMTARLYMSAKTPYCKKV